METVMEGGDSDESPSREEHVDTVSGINDSPEHGSQESGANEESVRKEQDSSESAVNGAEVVDPEEKLDSPDGGTGKVDDSEQSSESIKDKADGINDEGENQTATGGELDSSKSDGDKKDGDAESGGGDDTSKRDSGGSDLGEDINSQDKDTGNTKLHTAAMAFDKKAVTDLLTSGASVDRLNFKNRTAFHEMTLTYLSLDVIGQAEWRKCFKDIVDLLVQHGLDVNDKDINGRTPLHYVAPYQEHDKLVQHFVENLVDIDVTVMDKHRQTPLHLAVVSNTFDIVKMIVEKKRDVVNVKDQAGQTPLHIAAKGRSKQMTILHLIKYGAGPNRRDNGGRTPLHLAAKYGRVENVEALLDKGARIFELDHSGQSPLHYAAAKDVTGKCVQCLLSASRGSTDILDLQETIARETALHMALRLQMLDNVKILMRSKPNVNLRDVMGESALHKAVGCSEVFVWKQLLSLRGNIGLQNHALMSPYQKALKAKNQCATALMQAQMESIMRIH